MEYVTVMPNQSMWFDLPASSNFGWATVSGSNRPQSYGRAWNMSPNPFFSCCLTKCLLTTALAQVMMQGLCLIWIMSVYRKSQRWQSFLLELAESSRFLGDSYQVLSGCLALVFFQPVASPLHLGTWKSSIRDSTITLPWGHIFEWSA